MKHSVRRRTTSFLQTFTSYIENYSIGLQTLKSLLDFLDYVDIIGKSKPRCPIHIILHLPNHIQRLPLSMQWLEYRFKSQLNLGSINKVLILQCSQTLEKLFNLLKFQFLIYKIEKIMIATTKAYIHMATTFSVL